MDQTGSPPLRSVNEWHSEKLTHLGAHIARVAHELNTPVSLIAGSLGNLEEHVDALLDYVAATKACADRDPELARAYEAARVEYVLANANALLAICDEGVQRLNYIVDQLRGFSRRGSGMESETVDLAATLRRAELLARSGREAAPVVAWALAPVPRIAANEQVLIQALVNVIGNAFDAVAAEVSPAVRIEMGITPSRTHIEIRVCDNGPGISPAIRAAIFTPFFTTKASGTGLGLGLAIAKEAIEQHGGTIDLGKPDGRGAEFVIRLPVNDGEVIVACESNR